MQRYESLSRLLEQVLSLLVVALLLLAAAVWTGRIMGRDLAGSPSAYSVAASGEPLPAEVAQALLLDAEKAQVKELLARQRDSVAWTVVAADGTPSGTVVYSRKLAPDVAGFAGPVPLYVRLDAEGRVVKIVAGPNSETPDFFRRVERNGLLQAWDGLTAAQAADKSVDAVSGATYSSRAVIDNAHAVFASLSGGDSTAGGRTPAIGWGPTAALLGVLAFGLAASLFLRKQRWARPVALCLNVAVTGFWCGQFLSLSLLRGWLSSGFSPWLYLPAAAMLLLAVVLPLFGKKGYYCLWVCPLGSLQELAYRIPGPKIKVKPAAFRLMRRVRTAALLLLLCCLWMGWGAWLLDYEPFTVFLLSEAAPAVVALAAVIVVAGWLVPNPWCKCLCPVGELLRLAGDAGEEHRNKPEAHARPGSVAQGASQVG